MYKNTTGLSSSWSGWSLQGGQPVTITSQIQVGTLPDGDMAIFGIGSDGNIYEDEKTGGVNSFWSGFQEVSGSLASTPKFLSVGKLEDGRLQLFATAANGYVYSNYMTSTSATSWYGWGVPDSSTQSGLFTGQVQIGYLPDGATNLFVIGTDKYVYQDFKTDGTTDGGWSGWSRVNSQVSSYALSFLTVGAFQQGDGRLNLFVTDTNGNISGNYMFSGTTTWAGWGSQGTQSTTYTGQIQIGYLADGRLNLAAVGSDHYLYGDYKTGDVNSAWSGWGTLVSTSTPSGGFVAG
jgi:hypothetical protein